jgi:hypothetical protein
MLQRGGGHERVRASAADGWGRAAARERGWRGTSAGVRGWDAWAASGGRGFSFFSFSISFLFSFP